jgi:nitrogen fixation protein NifT
MKVTIRKEKTGAYSVYVAKKDLEEIIVESEKDGLWGGTVTLGNGWRLALPEMDPAPALPITVDARRLGE